MKVRTSQVITVLIVGAGLIVALAVLRSPRPNPSKVKLDSTDKFLSQVQDIRERGGGSPAKDGQVLSVDKKMPDKPMLEFEQVEINMGTIPNDRVTQKRVPVKNVGEHPVDILDIQTTCYCTEGKFELSSVTADGRKVSTIAPGGKMDLIISVYPDRIHGFYALKHLTISTNDPVSQQYVLDVETRVDPEFTIEPESIDFGTVQRGMPAEVHAVIRQRTETPIDISAVQINSMPVGDPRKGATVRPPVTIELTKRPEANWAVPGKAEWDLHARLSEDAIVGEFVASYMLQANLKRVSSIEGKIRANVVAFFDVSPQSLGARNVATPGQKDVATATVTSKDPISVIDITVTGNDLIAEVKQGSTPTQVEITLSVKPDATGGLKNEAVSFTVKSGNNFATHSMRAFVSVQAPAAAPAA